MNDLLLIRTGTNLMNRLTVINGNVDVHKLLPSIRTAQIIDIKRILSTDLYNKILADFDNNSLDGEYLKIYDEYVSPMLIFYSTSDFIMKNSIIVGNGGNFKYKPDNGEIADYKEVDRLSKYYRELGAHFEIGFYEYMKNITLPEYKRDCVDINTFKLPWYL